MRRDESNAERLWDKIEACKRNGSSAVHGSASAPTNGAAGHPDSALIHALCMTLQEEDSASAADRLAARTRLQAAIGAATAAPSAVQPAIRRGFWNVSGRRQVLLAAALILLTVAAIGYAVWASWPELCSGRVAPWSVPNGASPSPPARNGGKVTFRSANILIPISLMSSATPRPHRCKHLASQ